MGGGFVFEKIKKRLKIWTMARPSCFQLSQSILTWARKSLRNYQTSHIGRYWTISMVDQASLKNYRDSISVV